MKQFKRSERLSEMILRDVSALLVPELSELIKGMVTFTRVKLTDDLRFAKIYYSYLGDVDNRPRLENYFKQKNKQIRSMVGKNLQVRYIPEITFVFDPSVEEGIRIEQLLNELKRENKEK